MKLKVISNLQLEDPLYYRFILRIIVFAGFLLLCVTNQADFHIIQIEAHMEFLKQKIWLNYKVRKQDFKFRSSEAPLLIALINKIIM